jgi:trimeric autotransporter adhesin
VSTPAGGLVGDAHINVNANTTQATAALNRFTRDVNGNLRDVRGRFVSESRLINTAFNRAAGGGSAFSDVMEKLKASAISLAPALIPIAAQAAPIAASVGAAAVAVGAFAAAAAGQVTALTEASEAEKKYKDAVAEHGAASKEAGAASAAYARQLAQMPPATREAAAGLSVLKDQYKSWSDGLAGSTMPVATKAFATFGAIFPKLTPMVQGAGVQLDRFVTIAAGGVASPGFDRFMRSLSEFSTRALARANDGLIRFLRTLDTGKVSGGFSTFMDYVRANGPMVRDTLAKLGEALANVLAAAANVGPGLLTVVNALAKLVAAVPPAVITTLLQLSLAMRAVRLAAVAMAATSGGVAAFTASVTAMRLAAAGATGALPRLAAAIGAMSRATKVAIAGTGIGLLLIALTELSQWGKKTPPDVDKLTTSLRNFSATGKVSGEAARVFGKDLAGLADSIQMVSNPKGLDKVQQSIISFFGADSTPVKEAKERIDAVDKSLANLVKNNQADLAAAALERLSAAYAEGGRDTGEFTKRLDDYKASLADQKFEQELAAQAMGLFGQQAQQTSAKLAAQKASTDGLRAAIQALNDVNRGALGAMNAFEAAVDSTAKAAAENAGSLRMVHGQLDLNSEKARTAEAALRDLATQTDGATAAARESGASWETVNGIYTRGRASLIASAQAMGLTKAQAKSLADQILKTPDKTAKLKGNMEDLEAKLKSARDKLAKVPDSRKAKLLADISDLQNKVNRARAELDRVDGKTATTYVVTRFTTVNATSKVPIARRDYATGGPIGFPGGGPIRGPGTGTSDSIPIMASDGEYMINARSTAKYRSLIEAINADKLGAGTGMGGAGAAVAQGLASGMTGSTGLVLAGARQMAAAVAAGVRGELQISSPSKVMQALGKDTGAGFIKGLTGTREQISRTAASIADSITKAFRGRKTTVDDRLVAMVAFANKRLQGLAAERDRIAQRIADAKKFSADVAAQAKGAFSLQAVTQGPAGVSGDTIRRGLSAAAGQIREFIGRINVLRKRGLSKDLLAQIIGMGPEAGLEFANVLSRQSSSSLKEINRLQGQINKASTDLGKLSADALFDAGKQSGRGFLAGLAGQQKQIEQLMLSIAKSMQKAIRKALGIKSPSTVMAEVGRQSTLGLAAGLVDRLPAVDQAMSRVAGRVAGVRPTGPALSVGATRTATASTQTTNVINVNFTNHGVISSKQEFRDYLVRELDTLKLMGRLPIARR